MNDLIKFLTKNIGVIALVCVTLGLAPFAPEPHIWGKIKWIKGGAVGMELMDWFDTLLHGVPFLLLILAIIFKALDFFDKKPLKWGGNRSFFEDPRTLWSGSGYKKSPFFRRAFKFVFTMN